MRARERAEVLVGSCAWILAAPAPALAAAELRVGLVPETSVPLTILRVALALWAGALLLTGRRPPRFAAGSFFLLAGAALAWRPIAPVSLLLVAVAATAVLAAGLALHAAAPRVAMALALVWPLPAVYAAHVMLGGGFKVSQGVLLTLALVGAVIGAVAPDAAAGVLGAALGTVLLAVAWGGEPRFWPLFTLFALATAWQAALALLARPPLVPARPVRPAARVARAASASGLGAVAMLAVLLLIAVTAPVPQAAGPAHTRRVAALERALGERPAVVLSSEDSFYLFGRPLPVALVGSSGSPAARLGVVLRGRGCGRELTGMRTVKDVEELETMRRAAAITASAFRAVAPLIRPGANERDLEAAVLAAFREGGATGLAFESVVGSGRNAVLPHYRRNDAELREGLVVIDIGCSVDAYASDMTRTFPVSGEWSAAQRRLLDAVLAAKSKARAALKPGASLRELNRAAHASIAAAGFGEYFIHSLSHHVGLDVHDIGADTLAEGMVVTIEPGIYIPAGAAVDRAYWDLGIRVEDTYVVTGDGGVPLAELPEVLPCGSAS